MKIFVLAAGLFCYCCCIHCYAEEQRFHASAIDGALILSDAIVVGEVISQLSYYRANHRGDVYFYRIRVTRALPKSLEEGGEIVVRADHGGGVIPEIPSGVGSKTFLVLRREAWGYSLLAGHQITDNLFHTERGLSGEESVGENVILTRGFWLEGSRENRVDITRMFNRLESRSPVLFNFLLEPSGVDKPRFFLYKQSNWYGWFVLRPDGTGLFSPGVTPYLIEEFKWLETPGGLQLKDDFKGPEGVSPDADERIMLELVWLPSPEKREMLVGREFRNGPVLTVWPVQIENIGQVLREAVLPSDVIEAENLNLKK